MTDSSANYASVPGDGNLVAAVAPTTVQVVAPSALPGGYQLHVDDVQGRHMVVLVPEGGVKEGQQFHGTVIQSSTHVEDALAQSDGHNIPQGRWRDGICEFCKHGCCHAMCWLAFCFPPIVLGQVQTRNKLDYSGAPLQGRVPKFSAFKIMLAVFFVYYALDTALGYTTQPYLAGEFNEDTGTYTYPSDIPTWVIVVHGIHQGLAVLYAAFILVVLIRTRSHIRAKYQIPEETCQGCEDCCCAFFCGTCTVCQMARHTADYSQYDTGCCSETGLDPRAPEVV